MTRIGDSMRSLLPFAALLLAGCHHESFAGVVQAPELSMGSAIVALTLTAGIVLCIVDRRKS